MLYLHSSVPLAKKVAAAVNASSGPLTLGIAGVNVATFLETEQLQQLLLFGSMLSTARSCIASLTRNRRGKQFHPVHVACIDEWSSNKTFTSAYFTPTQL